MERNPGSDSSVSSTHENPFVQFVNFYSETFLGVLDSVTLGRSLVQVTVLIKGREGSLERFRAWVEGCYEISDELLLKIIAGYTCYASVSLTYDATGNFLWEHPPIVDSAQITDLRHQIEQLQIKLDKSVPKSLETLSLDNCNKFQKLSPLPKWMHSFATTFHDHLSNDLSPRHTLEKLWADMVHTQQEYSTKYPSMGTTQSSAGSASKSKSFTSKKADLTLTELEAKGGKVYKRPTPFGESTFADLDGKTYYFANKSQTLWDTGCPPPGGCNRCNKLHWFWECPLIQPQP